MEFQNNVALLYDSFILNQEKSKIYSVLSFTGNAAYIKALASDLINDFSINEIEDIDIELLLHDMQKSVRLLALLGKLSENKDKVGFVSYFVDKDYGLYLFLMGLLFPNLVDSSENKAGFIDFVYKQYSKKTNNNDGEINVYENFEILNRYVKGLINTHSEYSQNRSYYVDNSEKVANLATALESLYSSNVSDKLLSEFIFYSHDIIKIYQSLGVNDIRSTRNAGERLHSVVRLMPDKESLNISFLTDDDSNDYVRKLAIVLLKLVEYNMRNLYKVKDIRDLSENDRYLFVIVWSLFQGKKNEWMFSKDIFQKIRELFESVKKAFNV